MRVPFSRPVLAYVVLMLIATVAAVGLSRAAPAQAAVVSPGASTTHPYSNPVWWPLNTPSMMGCYRGNPPAVRVAGVENCQTDAAGNVNIQHSGWAWDIVSVNRSQTDPLEPVFPLGAGIVHIGATGWRCNPVHSRGNWLYVDHGNGVLTYYGHLGRITVVDGQYVTARNQIATVGNSGYSRCAEVTNFRYLYLALKYGGTAGQYVEIRTLNACVDAATQVWPQQLVNNPAGAWQYWNAVPSTTPLQAPSGGRSCIPTSVRTTDRPTGQRLSSPSAGRLTASWTRAPSSVTVLTVQLQEWHPTISRWLDVTNRRLAGTTTQTTFAGLASHRGFRMRVWFGNSIGWSLPSLWTSEAVTR